MRGKTAKKLRKLAQYDKDILNDPGLEVRDKNVKYYGGKLKYKINKKAWKMTPRDERII